MQTLTPQVKDHMLIARYMDDIIRIQARCPTIDTNKLAEDFQRSECYLPPLKLENARDDTFLETTFKVTESNSIRYWLKNDNDIGKPQRIWRYAHFDSAMNFMQKKSILQACLKKIDRMASDAPALYDSAITKLSEFWHLDYPDKMLWSACTTMGVCTRDPTWFDIRDDFPYVTKDPAMRVVYRTVQRPVPR